MNGGNNGSNGPCGACKFLRRKCVKGCIFAPYFDADQGTAHFAAVHKVFGASNASKLLLRVPAHKRLEAVVSMCYEALARVRDPVYGCVSHIFALQQQVVNLQAELAFVQARLSTLHRLPLMMMPPPQSPSSSSSMASMQYKPLPSEGQTSSSMAEMGSFNYGSMMNDGEFESDELGELAQRFVSRCLPGFKCKPSSSQ